MSPAAELTQAADKLDALAWSATSGPWSILRNNEGAIRAIHNGTDMVVLDADVAEQDARYIAAMNPLVGKALAVVMREAADVIIHNLEDRIPQGYPPIRVASAGLLDLARLINGGAS